MRQAREERREAFAQLAQSMLIVAMLMGMGLALVVHLVGDMMLCWVP